MSNNGSILTIVGPTAVGKTSVAINVAHKIGGEIIGLDSRQIYKGMTIGTAQPSKKKLEQIPHHFISTREPNETISAGEYSHLVNKQIQEIRNRDKEPIICGGAGLYLEALTKGIFEGSVADLEIRERLNAEYDQDPNVLMKRLTEIDPEYAVIVHPNNKKRLVRALEIFEITGKPPSDHHANQSTDLQNDFSFCTILLSMDMEKLEQRIRERTQKMLANGWIEETKDLLEKYSVNEAHALDSIGYRQICQHLNGEYSLAEVEDEIVLRTRQYAKRQLTWFRNRSKAIEIDVEKSNNVNKLTQEIISIWKRSKTH